VDAIECQWDPGAFDSGALQVCHRWYPHSRNDLLSPSVPTPHWRRSGELEIYACTPAELRAA
jgi:hypothetical protein